MKKTSLSEEINSIFDILRKNKQECSLKNIFPDLPGYAKADMDSARLEPELPLHPFLSELTLCDLELPPEPAQNRIVFRGTMKSLPDFLREAVCYDQIAGIRTLECHITQNEYGEITFAGIYCGLKGISIRMADFDLELESFSFNSGTTGQSSFLPRFVYRCLFPGGRKAAACTADQILGEPFYSIYGDFSSADDLTIDQIFSLFHMTDISIGDYLPEGFGAAVFDCLKLKDFSIEASRESMQAFTAEVSSKNALTLAGDKITFVPGLYISVNTSSEQPVLNFYAYGECSIGGSLYEIYVNPGRMEMSLGLKEGSVLDIAAVSKLFFEIELPALCFDRLYAHMGFGAGSYAFELGAVDVLEFGVAEKRIVIEGIWLRTAYEGGSFFVSFTGRFDVCGVAFETSGSYSRGGNYSFSCCITRNTGISLSALFCDFFGHSCLLSDSFDFTISSLIFVCNLQKTSSFHFAVSAEFSGRDQMLKKLFSLRADAEVEAAKEEGRWRYSVDIGCRIEIKESQELDCRYRYDSMSSENGNMIFLSWKPKTPEDVVTLEDILNAVGFGDIDASWHFITQIGIGYAGLSYDFEKKRLSGEVKIHSGGGVKIWMDFGEERGYGIVVSFSSALSFADLPVAGGLTDKFPIRKEDFGVKDLTVYALSSPDEEKQIPAGVRMDFTVFGSRQQWQIYEAGKKSGRIPAAAEGGRAAGEPVLLEQKVLLDRGAGSGNGSPAKVFWFQVEKSLAIFSLHRIGVGLDDPYMTFLADASLNVAPLRFDLLGAGIGVALSNMDMEFYLSGFGISYTSPALVIGGALMKTGGAYAGQLIVQTKAFSLSAAAEYRTDGHLFAYALIAADIGGPPAFYMKGLALGFGYNKRLALPSIDKVADYPLVKSASGKMDAKGMLADLDTYMEDENGQKFLAVGLKFSTFEIAESFVLLTASFGNDLEIGLLGVSDITMPPKCDKNVQPIAHAQLALKAQIKPEEGVLGIEARLTSESYILSRDCHLTGGFAFFMWFGGIHAGDFVITLGGYHPKYEKAKPAHYPDAPRVGFQWNIGEHTNITGEAYFALTPGALMAGGRLSITYTLGNLKAYFIAKADFLINWKPFHYDIEIGVTLGASYHVKLWFISKTITLELGTDLHIWGPDFSAVARIKIWIVSVTVKIGADASQRADDLDWQEFCSSFLPGRDGPKRAVPGGYAKEFGRKGETISGAAPLKIVFGNGLSGEIPAKRIKTDGVEADEPEEEKIPVVSSNGAAISIETSIPITAAVFNGSEVAFTPADVSVKPMGGSGHRLLSDLTVEVKEEGGGNAAFDAFVIRRNMPSALWGGKEELKRDVPCGIRIVSRQPKIVLFPKKNDISLDDLYAKGTEKIEKAFAFRTPDRLPDYTDKDTIAVFGRTADDKEVKRRRRQFLETLGVELSEDISIAKYAAEADDYLDEEVLIPVYGSTV